MDARFIVFLFLISLGCLARTEDSNPLFDHLKWRCIGPHRGGRTVGAVGIPGKDNEFLIGVNHGGVWKTTDFGRTWQPIFDDQPTGSIGTIAVDPNSPETIYVGCGEGLQRPDLSVGNGIYKSTNGGKTWQHCGLDDGYQISGIVVDPRNKNRVLVAVVGHPYGPNKVRGLYETVNGGKDWVKILGPDDNTGATQVALDPKEPQTLYCSLWAARQAPWENGRWQGTTSGLYKSVDNGKTWKKLEKGLPTIAQGLGRIGFSLSEKQPKLIVATVDAQTGGGIYKSDDGGESWKLLSTDPRLWTRGDDFAEIKIDPKHPNVIYCANTATYRSEDGGKNWTCWKGAPGGDDYHTIWIHPDNTNIVLLASDQGATITVNGGQTWSSWYNQPTAQFYHVSTDNEFPYNVYGGQQESGSVGISSRGADGQITFRDWHPVGVEEYGYVAVDPLDSNIIYGGKLTRYDKRTGQVQEIRPPQSESVSHRFLRTAPVIFSPINKKRLYFAGNVLFMTDDGGQHWKTISPDLSRPEPEVPKVFQLDSKPMASPGRRGVIYSVAPSFHDTKIIWCGTDDGLIWVTQDGGDHWVDITPPQLTSWSKISQLQASHFDPGTAFASVTRMRCDDMKPYVYVTHDFGKTWALRVNGLPDDPINAVREDHQVPGLLFCATERMVHVSFDEGQNWESLRCNMPCTSIRDLVIHDDDIVVGTHGRSFWILDNITSLRQIHKLQSRTLSLFDPPMATRTSINLNTDTPLPPEEPGGENPPAGAMIEYVLPRDAKIVRLEILNESGIVVRSYSSNDKPFVADPNKIPLPTYWLGINQSLPSKAGVHRFCWDMRFDPLDPAGNWVTMAAILRKTPTGPLGPWAPAGTYTIRLSADDESRTAKLQLRLDPRVKMSDDDIESQRNIIGVSYDAIRKIDSMTSKAKKSRAELEAKLKSSKSEAETAKWSRVISALDKLIDSREGLPHLRSMFSEAMNSASSADMPMTQATTETFARAATEWPIFQTAWQEIQDMISKVRT